MIGLLSLLFQAKAYVDPACQEVADQGIPDGYSEQGQQDFLLNYFALATTFSPAHAPIPADPGTGMIGLEIAVIPPLGCHRRLVLNYTKTEDTNKVPALPRPRVSFVFPSIQLGSTQMSIYGSLGYVPPLEILETQNVIVSAEAGVGFGNPEKGLQYGLRYHATLMKSIAEIATPFEEGGETKPDFYMGSTFGADVMLGYRSSHYTPYLAVGFTDVSTFFYIDDDGLVVNNMAPYAGFTTSAGIQAKILDNLQTSAEVYFVPKQIVTARLNLSLLFQ
ncbi:MAG: hypothetical protein CL916_11860 [Deltaproteobacteria bacterium]|nr:hypothetical protein [Deltaproteobacteria bacterium]